MFNLVGELPYILLSRYRLLWLPSHQINHAGFCHMPMYIALPATSAPPPLLLTLACSRLQQHKERERSIVYTLSAADKTIIVYAEAAAILEWKLRHKQLPYALLCIREYFEHSRPLSY